MQRYDSIIVGAGHNGLVCAGYLAKAGQKVLLLDASAHLGGLAATREFHPGFQASVVHSLGQFSTQIASDLNLESHGFKARTEALPTIGLDQQGEHVVLREGAPGGLSADDAESYAAYSRLMRRFAEALKPFWFKAMPRVGNNSLTELMTFAHAGLKLRLLGKDDLREFLRIAALPTRDLMDEYFDNPVLKATLSWDGLIGSKLAPRSPNGAVMAMLFRMAGAGNGAHVLPENGVAGLIGALASSAKALGTEIRCGKAVERILVEADSNGLKASGVRLVDGSSFQADRVISAADPQTTFLKLVGVENLEIGFANRIKRLRCDGYVAKMHLALNGLPEISGLDRLDGRMIIAPDMDAIEFAFDDAKYGECSKQPVVEITIPSVRDTSMAPSGQHVLSAHVMYVPYRLKGGWNEAAREALCERVIDTIASYAPGIREQIVHRELLTPLDLEQSCHVSGGHWHHTEFAMDQILMMRPTYEAAQYSTPVPGLYLCGAGCHPGGGIMGAPGHNAARVILQ